MPIHSQIDSLSLSGPMRVTTGDNNLKRDYPMEVNPAQARPAGPLTLEVVDHFAKAAWCLPYTCDVMCNLMGCVM